MHGEIGTWPVVLELNAMEATDTDRRVTELEIKIGLAEDMLDQLNQTLFRQQQLIERLAREMADLRQQVPDSLGSRSRNPIDDIPPHY